MIFRNKESGNKIRVTGYDGYGTLFETLNKDGEVTGKGSMATYLLETEFEEVEE